MSQNPNCWTCRFFRITWEPQFPYGCDAMGFKSQILPSLEVLRADGDLCRAYSPKPLAADQTQPPSSTSRK